ncbi:hypothetical protein J6590_020607 [Homalodisca vitripennis]|nr:hypothetical protein J6590_020607 [Homalodisca vitripennis]
MLFLEIERYSRRRNVKVTSSQRRYTKVSSSRRRYTKVSSSQRRYTKVSSSRRRYAKVSSSQRRYAKVSSSRRRYAKVSYSQRRYAKVSSSRYKISSYHVGRTATKIVGNTVLHKENFSEYKETNKETHTESSWGYAGRRTALLHGLINCPQCGEKNKLNENVTCKLLS